MKIIVNGAGGAMGKVLCQIIADSGKHEAVALCSMEFTTDKENIRLIYQTYHCVSSGVCASEIKAVMVIVPESTFRQTASEHRKIHFHVIFF